MKNLKGFSWKQSKMKANIVLIFHHQPHISGSQFMGQNAVNQSLEKHGG